MNVPLYGEGRIPVPEISRGDIVYASVVAFFAWVFSVYDYILFGLLLPVIATSFHWSTAQSVLVNTWVTVGAFILAMCVGPITDYLGRRNALTLVTVGAALSSGLTALAATPLYTILVRSLSGFGYSEQAVNTTYLSELHGAERRGFGYSLIQCGWPAGVILAASLTNVLLPVVGWRGVFAVATLPAIIIVFLRLRLKETPRFVYMRTVRQLVRLGRRDEAEALGREQGINVDRVGRFTYRQLFAPDVAKHTVFLTLAYTVQWIAAGISVIFATTILTQGKGIPFSASLVIFIVANLAGLVGYLVLGYVGDRVGRRNTVLLSWGVCGVLWAIMLLWVNGYDAVMAMYAAFMLFSAGSYAPMLTYSAESFPTRMRGSGVAFVNAWGQVGGLVGSALFAAFLTRGIELSSAAAYLGLIPMLLASLLMLGARNIPPGTALESIAR